MINEIISITEYDEGFAIIEDTQGKYIAMKDTPEITALEFPRCWLTDSSRDRMALLT